LIMDYYVRKWYVFTILCTNKMSSIHQIYNFLSHMTEPNQQNLVLFQLWAQTSGLTVGLSTVALYLRIWFVNISWTRTDMAFLWTDSGSHNHSLPFWFFKWAWESKLPYMVKFIL
jgi:hypothetical protein